MNILVLGYFGFVTNQLDVDGQTVKTRDIYNLFLKEFTGTVDFFDTQTFKKSKFNLINLLKKLIKADVVFYLPAQSNLKYIFPFVFIITKLLRIKFNYLVVGGWLYEFLKNKPMHRYMLARIDGIYTETENLKKNLQKYGFLNVDKLHNFRAIQYPMLNHKVKNMSVIKLVFMARVQPMKGVEVLFKLDKTLKEKKISNVTIDIFGPVTQEYEQQFLDNISNSNISYYGIIEPEKIHDTLQNYDLMLFPTKYYTEGFPGSILDAYISGVPVIATRWLNAEEFINEGQTGFIVDFDNEQAFIDKAVSLIYNPESFFFLDKNIAVKREEYSDIKAWDILKQAIKTN
jgi:glycosyltransferase involved in cell wall biosynthesis